MGSFCRPIVVAPPLRGRLSALSEPNEPKRPANSFPLSDARERIDRSVQSHTACGTRSSESWLRSSSASGRRCAAARPVSCSAPPVPPRNRFRKSIAAQGARAKSQPPLNPRTRASPAPTATGPSPRPVSSQPSSTADLNLAPPSCPRPWSIRSFRSSWSTPLNNDRATRPLRDPPAEPCCAGTARSSYSPIR